jgi:hypothetical protein
VGEQIQKNEMSGAWSTCGRDEMCIRTSVGKRDGRRRLTLDIGGDIIIMYTFKECKG